ncbi:SurA N-terminal domain-containing protein [Halomonas elongata]|uniref:PpiC-type peptidyl-prolyl cis-trans isomerase SurA n=1 Tax=Halomonas elongata (strain ATCC 33173 / DSM 2581 / NBRC 15536 / NCIMB 2198 / 1H9) TaxID=768066 RepID=E1V6Y9_HALED|nr:SurA N-terminal domain-containing protein [Halomonas elongata]MBW5799546.1 SurA N-terminal domain-containing protein [Halomonas elongata]MDL4862734.1 SurA N-terminal domain-containing protein [Halomonas elongata]RAW09069.1 peptidylprolyl isomerase [Halomonas elongata]WBF17117.1 SurA N-terminal domain-containing protein [Halomonas elongata]WPU45951.1 SurA N-terminal domain-containing protein [Halomonas elongata DSM 2581]
MRSRQLATLTLALCLGLAPVGVMAQDARQPLDRIVAVVNEGAIMNSQLEERVARTRAQMEAQGVEVPPDDVLRQQVLDRLVIEEIQLQMAREANLSVDDTELNRQVRAIAQNNDMTLEQFADALEADGLSLGVVRDQVRRELLMRQIQQRRVGSRVSISEAEVNRFIEQQGGNVTAEQARQALFQRKANDEMEAWVQEIRSQAFVDERLGSGS